MLLNPVSLCDLGRAQLFQLHETVLRSRGGLCPGPGGRVQGGDLVNETQEFAKVAGKAEVGQAQLQAHVCPNSPLFIQVK